MKILDFIYLISVYIETGTKDGYYHVYKNAFPIAYGISSLTDYAHTTSVTVIEHLTVNDSISVTGTMHVYGKYQSCLTILQIK